MRNLHRLHVSLRCLVVALVAACSSSSSTPSPDAAVVTDTPAVTDAPAVTDTAPASDTTPAGDAGACVDFTGGYTVTGTCSLPGVVPFPAVCIAQTGCSAQINLEGAVVTGTVVGGRLTFTTSTMGVPLTCTVDRNGDGSTAVRCEAAGGAVTCDAVAAAPSFPGATRFCCNVTAQDCGAGQRCTVVGVGASLDELQRLQSPQRPAHGRRGHALCLGQLAGRRRLQAADREQQGCQGVREVLVGLLAQDTAESTEGHPKSGEVLVADRGRR